MKKLLLSFSKPADQWLRSESERLGIPLTELVRRIVDEKRLATVEQARARTQ
jgi:hypothetical protein